MVSIVLLAGQLGVVIASFVGVSSAVSWYHKGGEQDGKSRITRGPKPQA